MSVTHTRRALYIVGGCVWRGLIKVLIYAPWCRVLKAYLHYTTLTNSCLKLSHATCLQHESSTQLTYDNVG
jgi:hypothetical protein